MKRFLVWFFVFIATVAQAQTMGGSSGPVIWSGPLAQVLPSTGLSLPANKVIRLYESTANGTNFIALQGAANMATDYNFIFPSTNGTTAYALLNTGSGNTTWGQVDLTAGVTGVLPLANGGTNKNMTASAGSVAYSDSDSLELSAVGSTGQYLKSNGTGGPTWSAVDLANSASVTGVLPLANGGTNKNMTAVNGGVVWTDADSQEVTAAGTTGQYLKSNGAAAPTWGAIDISTASITGVLPLANGGTNKNMTAVAGGVVWTDADSQEVSAAGTAGMALKSTGTTAPAFGWNSVNVVSNAGYTFTNTDGYDAVAISTGSSNRTVTLPSASSNTGRELGIYKSDSGTGRIDISGTVNGVTSGTTMSLLSQYARASVISDGTSWYWSTPIQDSGSFSASFSGARTVSLTIKYVRNGDAVTLNVPTSTGVLCVSASLSASAAVPAALRPQAQIDGNALVQSGSQTYGNYAVTSGGNITFYKAAGNTAFDAANCGPYGTAITYNIN